MYSDFKNTQGTSGTSSVGLEDYRIYNGGTGLYAFHGIGTGVATFGRVAAYSEVILRDYYAALYDRHISLVSSDARFDDHLSVVPDNASITKGKISFTYALSGSGGSTNQYIDPSVNFNFNAQASDPNQFASISLGSDPGQQYPNGVFTTNSIPYTFGDNINMTGEIQTNIYQQAAPDYADPGPILASIHYEHTAILTGVNIFDAAGNPVSGFTITSGSGTSYPLAVPEPASLALFSLGLMAALTRRMPGKINRDAA